MTQPDTKNDRELAERMLCAQLHRGPIFLQGGTNFGSYFWSGGGGTAFGGGPNFA
jgi:hypothetical protein